MPSSLRIDRLSDRLGLQQKKPTVDNNAGYLDLGSEGICPKTGEKMVRVKLTACKTPQTVWYCEKSRVALPCTDPDLL